MPGYRVLNCPVIIDPIFPAKSGISTFTIMREGVLANPPVKAAFVDPVAYSVHGPFDPLSE